MPDYRFKRTWFGTWKLQVLDHSGTWIKWRDANLADILLLARQFPGLMEVGDQS